MRKSLLAAAAAGLSLTLVACGGGTSTTSPSATDGASSSAPAESSAPAAAGTLTVWVDETRIDAFKTIGESFLAATGVTLDVVQKPFTGLVHDQQAIQLTVR